MLWYLWLAFKSAHETLGCNGSNERFTVNQTRWDGKCQLGIRVKFRCFINNLSRRANDFHAHSWPISLLPWKFLMVLEATNRPKACSELPSNANLFFALNFSSNLGRCSHYAIFCLIFQKVCQCKAISSANDFLPPPKVLQGHWNLKDSVD